MNKRFSLLLTIALSLSSGAVMASPNWMANVPDSKKVKDMSLPGAHDAAAKNSTAGYGKCQDLDLSGLWDAGVRVFDLRAKYTGGTLKIYHGTSDTKVTMHEAMTTLTEKLNANPKEFAVILAKDEDNTAYDAASDNWKNAMASLAEEFDSYIVQFHPDITVGEMRGKILFLSRNNFNYSKIGGIDGWGDNSQDKNGTIYYTGSSTAVRLQDYYDKVDSATKTAAIEKLLFYAGNIYNHSWVINFCSGYTPGGILVSGGDSYIQANAKNSNKAAYDYLSAENAPTGGVGIILMDYAGTDASNYYGKSLTDLLIERNYEMNNEEMVAYFNNHSNWHSGAASKGVGTTTKKDEKNENGVTVIESYREDVLMLGEVLTCTYDNVPDGDYIVSLFAHAHFTPGRGLTASVEHGTTGCASVVVNSSKVDLPINHNTGFADPTSMYVIPTKVTDGKLTISIVNHKEGANWHACRITSIHPVRSETRAISDGVAYVQNFENDKFGWHTTTGAQNIAFKGGPSELSNTRCFENWISSSTPFTGKIYTSLNVPNGRYKVSLDVCSRTTDGDNIYFYANDEKRPVETIDPESKSAEVEVNNGKLEFGLKFDTPKANWAGVDNAKVQLLETFPTAIEEMETVSAPVSEKIYSIDGVFVGEGSETLETLAPGLYIYKGKKILLKK